MAAEESKQPEQPLETGSWFDLQGFSVNSQSEAIMRYWQLSEALSRMSKRIKKRYPQQARILARASEDICFEFYNSFHEAQKKSVSDGRKNADRDLQNLLDERTRSLLRVKLETRGQDLATALMDIQEDSD